MGLDGMGRLRTSLENDYQSAESLLITRSEPAPSTYFKPRKFHGAPFRIANIYVVVERRYTGLVKWNRKKNKYVVRILSMIKCITV